VGFCAIDHPLVSLDRPGCWKYSLDFVPRRPTAFVNLFNNQFNSNFRLWNEGTWTSRVRIWAIDRYDSEAALVTPSLEARFPLMAARTDGPPGPLPPARKGLELSRRGALVTAFGPNTDGAGTVLRIWEVAGRAGECIVHLPPGVQTQTVAPIDLRGQPCGTPIAVKDGAFLISLGASAPVSVLME
jgi:hypothetical protein